MTTPMKPPPPFPHGVLYRTQFDWGMDDEGGLRSADTFSAIRRAKQAVFKGCYLDHEASVPMYATTCIHARSLVNLQRGTDKFLRLMRRYRQFYVHGKMRAYFEALP